MTSKDLIGHHAEGVDIGGGSDLPALRLLGGDVLGRAHHHAGLGQRHRLRGLRDTEVRDLHRAIGGEQQIGGLDIPVHRSGGVDRSKAHRGLPDQVQGQRLRQLALATQHIRQTLATDILHHDVAEHRAGLLRGLRAVCGDLPVVVGGDHIRGIEVLRGLRLIAEALAELRAFGVLGLQDLDSHVPLRDGIAGEPHGGHPAPANDPAQLVALTQ